MSEFEVDGTSVEDPHASAAPAAAKDNPMTTKERMLEPPPRCRDRADDGCRLPAAERCKDEAERVRAMVSSTRIGDLGSPGAEPYRLWNTMALLRDPVLLREVAFDASGPVGDTVRRLDRS
jgi:hypothetical protein